MKFIIILLAVIFLLRFIGKYIIPVFRLTSMTNDRLRQMQDQMREMDRKVAEQQTNNSRPKTRKSGDYIDYEEVR
jgi:hypothetical protein